MGRAILLGILVCLLSGCFMPDAIVKSEQTAKALVANDAISSATVDTQDSMIHYVYRPIEQQNLVVFIHGTPGDWTIFAPQLESSELAQEANLVAIDRPRWGKSTLKSDDGDLSLAKQSRLIGPALVLIKEKYKSDNLVIVGHSLGASLAPKIAMDFPEVVDAVVVLAGDLTDEYPAAHWYNHAASSVLLSWAVPKGMELANDEVMALSPSLADMKPDWGKIKAPLLVIQGQKDNLVDPRHADFAETVETQNAVKVVRFEKGNHLVHLTHTEDVNELIAFVVNRKENGFFKDEIADGSGSLSPAAR